MKRLLLLGLSVWPLLAFGQNGTTPGSVGLASTFQCVSVKANFTGDANANNSCVVQYRATGASAFTNAYVPLIDRRVASDAFVNQARVSIVGLTPNTSYDVKVTWSDPDGITGNASSTNTISTLTYAYPAGGSTTTVTSDATLATALSSVSAGQTIHLNPGTYSPITITGSGNSGAYIVIEGDSGGGSIIQGTNITQNVLVSANFIVIKNITFGPSDHSGVLIPVGGHHIYVQDCNFVNISTTCPNNVVPNYADAGVGIGTFNGGSSSSNIFVLHNGFHSAALFNSACTANPNYNSPGEGVIWHALTSTLVVQSNTVDGGFRDGITCDDDEICENIDQANNVVSNYKDDPLECKGYNVNVRVWGNVVTNSIGNTCSAFNATSSATPRAGPCYIFRNYFYVPSTNGLGGGNFKLAYTDCAPTFVFHNTVLCNGSGGWDGFEVGDTITSENNIIVNTGNGVFTSPVTSTFDYDVYKVGGNIASHWGPNTYLTLAAWQAGASQELHGIQNDPLLRADMSVPTNSPAVNAGVALANFNGANSLWPTTNANPTIGAFEFAVGAAVPTGPSITIQPQNRTVFVGATASFSVTAVTSGGALSYQWNKTGAAVSGATQSSYTTPATVLGDNGATFYCAVSDANGTKNSQLAFLTVNSPNPPPPVTYYASPNGNNSNDGLSTNTPWLISYALANAGASNTVVLMDGAYSNPQQLSSPWQTIKALNRGKAQFLNVAGTLGQGTWYGTAAAATGDTIDGLMFSNCQYTAIYVLTGCSNLTLRNLYVVDSGNNYSASQNASGVAVEAGLNLLVERCLFERCGTNNIGFNHGMYVAGTNGVFRNNVSRYNGGYGIVLNGHTANDHNNSIYNNLFYGNYGSGPSPGFFDQVALYADHAQSTENTYFYGNTVVTTNESYAIICQYGARYISNNIILATNLGIQRFNSDPIFADYNLAPQALQFSGPHDVVSVTTNFVSPQNGLYWLRSSSPARNVALSSVDGPVDFFGRAQNAVSDIGAFQYDPNLAIDTRVLDPSTGNNLFFGTNTTYWTILTPPPPPQGISSVTNLNVKVFHVGGAP